MTTVYVIKSVKRSYRYVGLTSNLEQRLMFHNLGYNKTTKPYAPFQLILSEEYRSRMEARKREQYLKSGVGREYLDSVC